MKRLAQSAVGTGSGTLLYTVPTGYNGLVEDIFLCNTSSGALTISIHFVASGGSATTSNAVFGTLSIPAYTTVSWQGKQLLTTGKFIQGIASGAGITVTITGEEIRVSI